MLYNHSPLLYNHLYSIREFYSFDSDDLEDQDRPTTSRNLSPAIGGPSGRTPPTTSRTLHESVSYGGCVIHVNVSCHHGLLHMFESPRN